MLFNLVFFFPKESHENELAKSFEKFTIPSEEEGFQDLEVVEVAWWEG